MRLALLPLLAVLLGPFPAWGDVDFDGVDDFGGTGLALSTFITNTTGSLEVWVTPTGAEPTASCNAAGAQGIFADESVSFKIARRNTLLLCVGNNDGAADVVQNTYAVGTTYHVVLVHTGGNIFMYVNGGPIGSPVASGNTTPLTGLLRLGGGSSAVGFIQGRIFYAAAYAVALPAAEIAAKASMKTYRGGTTMPTGAWELMECAQGANANGVVFKDISGNGRALTMNDGANNTGLTCQGNTLLTNNFGGQ